MATSATTTSSNGCSPPSCSRTRCLSENNSGASSCPGTAPTALWDTALLASLFAFNYVWEGFFPAANRRWCYYVHPILFADRLVGRIEPPIDRDRARVVVLDVWWEDGFAPRRADGFVDAGRDALRAYLRLAGADRLEWAPRRATRKRLFLTRP